MPMIDVYALAGAFEDKHLLARGGIQSFLKSGPGLATFSGQ